MSREVYFLFFSEVLLCITSNLFYVLSFSFYVLSRSFYVFPLFFV
jgi:hypothetical protein